MGGQAMKYLLILVVVMSLGCSREKALTMEEVVEQIEYCQDHGLTASVYQDGWSSKPVMVICKPIKDKP
jgi:hypothetical protein